MRKFISSETFESEGRQHRIVQKIGPHSLSLSDNELHVWDGDELLSKGKLAELFWNIRVVLRMPVITCEDRGLKFTRCDGEQVLFTKELEVTPVEVREGYGTCGWQVMLHDVACMLEVNEENANWMYRNAVIDEPLTLIIKEGKLTNANV